LTFERPGQNCIEGLGGGSEARGELVGVSNLKAMRGKDGEDALLMQIRDGGAE
jgi:hypothetical protein